MKCRRCLSKWNRPARSSSCGSKVPRKRSKGSSSWSSAMRHTWTAPVSSDGDRGGSVQLDFSSGCILEFCHPVKRPSRPSSHLRKLTRHDRARSVLSSIVPLLLPPTTCESFAEIYWTSGGSGNVANHPPIRPHHDVRSFHFVRNVYGARSIPRGRAGNNLRLERRARA